MDSLLLTSLDNLMTVAGIAYLFLGALVGLIFGVIPGLGGTTALALLIPLTFGMGEHQAILLLGGVMGAVSFGGSISAILLNAPGTSSNAATCLDGHPLARQGRAGLAIGAAACASSLGGLIGVAVLLLILPFAKSIMLIFGPPEFFLLAILGIVAVAISTSTAILRGLVTAGFGLVLAFVGYDDIGGELRFTGGIDYLWDGIDLIPALIGLFAIAEMIHLTVSGGAIAKDDGKTRVTGTLEGVMAVFKHPLTLLKGSLVGTVIGIMPGVGGTVASFLSYTFAAQTSPNRAAFGTGIVEGVIAPEAANNAKDGGSMVPTLAFGIPGSAEAAVFLGALVIHGLQPGPMLLIEHEDVVFSLIISLSISCVVASLIGVAFARWFALTTRIDASILVPLVLAFALVGTYAVRSAFGDVIVAVVFGVVGYAMIRFDYPRITAIIGLVLGGFAERNFHQSLMISRGDYGVFWSSGIVQALLLVLIVLVVWPVVSRWRNRHQNRGECV